MDDQALYLEADEDITSAIDKLRKAPEGPVQIVVPKRSTLLQSVINLKLLKKAADDSGRELVLVTSDKVATDLAGRVGLAVASSVGAKAVLPEVAEAAIAPAAEEVIEDDTPAPEAPPVSPAAADKRPDAMRKAAPVVTRRPVKEDEEPVAEVTAAVAGADAAGAGKPPKPPKVPNYGRFNKRLVWGGAAVALIMAYVVVMYFFSSAKVTLYAAASQVSVNTDFAVDPNAASYDDKTNVLPGQTMSGSKQVSSDFQATGSKDEGTKAKGKMTIINKDSVGHHFVAGTRFVAPDGKVFLLDTDTDISPGTPVPVPGGYATNPSQTPATVTAADNGDSYNEGPAKYSIPGLPASQQAYTYGQGDQMSGGTSKVVKVVQQSDIDAAQKAALDKVKDDELKDLKGKAKSTQYVITDSFSQTAANAASSPAVGEEATSATLTLTVNYTVLAVDKATLGKFVELQAKEQIGENNQIYDNGLGSAQVNADGKTDAGLAQFKINSSAYGGVKIDTDALSKQLRGKRYGEAVDLASKVAGVSRAEVSLWPAWATSVPRVAGHVKVKVSVASAKPSQ